MNPMMGGLFGVNKAPEHDPQTFEFGGYGADGNPIARMLQAPQANPMAGAGAPYALPKGRSMINPGHSMYQHLNRPGIGMGGGRVFPTGADAMGVIRAGAGGNMGDDVFNRWVNQGYDSPDERKQAWENAYGTGGVGGRWYQPLVTKAP